MVHVITPPPTTATQFQINWLAGPRLIGLLFNWGLLGVLTAQVYVYHINFPKDTRILKTLIYVVYLLDWAQTSSATYDAFQWFVWGWGDIPSLFLVYTNFLNVPLLSSTIGLLVQVFYGWRIWRFSRSIAIFALVCLLSALQFCGAVAAAVYLYNDASEVARNPHLVRAVGVRLVGSALADLVISVSMTYYLLRSRAQALGPMNNVLTHLIRLTVETGSITVVFAILDLVFFLKESNGLHQVSGVVLCKLYSNTMLVLLNNRLHDGNKLTTVHMGTAIEGLSGTGTGTRGTGVQFRVTGKRSATTVSGFSDLEMRDVTVEERELEGGAV